MAIVRAHDVPAAVLGTAVYNSSKDKTDAEQLVNSLRAAQDNAQQMRAIQAQQQTQASSQAFQGQQNALARQAQIQDRQDQYAQQGAQAQWQASYQQQEFDRRAAAELDQYREQQQLESAGYKEKLTMQQQMRKQELQQGLADVMNPAATPNYTPEQRARLQAQLQAEYHGIKGVYEPQGPTIDEQVKKNVKMNPDGSGFIMDSQGDIKPYMPPGKSAELDKIKADQALKKAEADSKATMTKNIAEATLKLREQSVDENGVVTMDIAEARKKAMELYGLGSEQQQGAPQQPQPAQPTAPQQGAMNDMLMRSSDPKPEMIEYNGQNYPVQISKDGKRGIIVNGRFMVDE